MQWSEFVRKFKSRYLWGNLAGMCGVVVAACVGLWIAMAVYTRHGESVTVPDLRGKKYADVERALDNLGLAVAVNDTGYVKGMPPECVLVQSPAAGERVKGGRTVFVTINATASPTIAMPDIIDNCSLRDAIARLSAMGFKIGDTRRVPGEKDWVYGVLAGTRSVGAGDRVSTDETLHIQAGDGEIADTEIGGDDTDLIEGDEGDVDEFQEVTE